MDGGDEEEPGQPRGAAVGVRLVRLLAMMAPVLVTGCAGDVPEVRFLTIKPLPSDAVCIIVVAETEEGVVQVGASANVPCLWPAGSDWYVSGSNGYPLEGELQGHLEAWEPIMEIPSRRFGVLIRTADREWRLYWIPHEAMSRVVSEEEPENRLYVLPAREDSEIPEQRLLHQLQISFGLRQPEVRRCEEGKEDWDWFVRSDGPRMLEKLEHAETALADGLLLSALEHARGIVDIADFGRGPYRWPDRKAAALEGIYGCFDEFQQAVEVDDATAAADALRRLRMHLVRFCEVR